MHMLSFKIKTGVVKSSNAREFSANFSAIFQLICRWHANATSPRFYQLTNNYLEQLR